jgi:hypothetical protein
LEKEEAKAMIACTDFNKVLVTLHNKHGIQDGITWTISDFQKQKD